MIDCVGDNDTSTLVGNFMSSPREREKREEEIVEEMKERGRGERRKYDSEEKRNKNISSLSLPAARIENIYLANISWTPWMP